MNTLKTKNLFQQLVSMKYGLPLYVYNLHVAHKRSLLHHWFVSTGVVLGHVLFTVPVFALLAGPCSREFWQMACVATFLPMLVDRSQIWRMCLLLNTPWTLLRRLDTCKIQAYCLVQAKRAHKHYLMLSHYVTDDQSFYNDSYVILSCMWCQGFFSNHILIVITHVCNSKNNLNYAIQENNYKSLCVLQFILFKVCSKFVSPTICGGINCRVNLAFWLPQLMASRTKLMMKLIRGETWLSCDKAFIKRIRFAAKNKTSSWILLVGLGSLYSCKAPD